MTLARSPCVLVPELHLPSVPLDGFLVARQPYPGVSIGEALDLAREHGCVMPTKRLVDALYTQADCKLNAWNFAEATDGTARTMAAPALILANERKVNAAIASWEAKHGRRARLVVGGNKIVIVNEVEYKSAYGRTVPVGAPGIYGWHDSHGKPIQGANYEGAGPRSHVRSWRDYSQAWWAVSPLVA